MTTTYYLHGSNADLDAISGRLLHRHKSRAIAILGDDEPGLPAKLIMRQHSGSTPDLGWIAGALAVLQRQHEAGQPWDAKEQRKALQAWRKGRDRLIRAEREVEEARNALEALSRTVVLTHGNRPIIDGDTKLTPGFVACNDRVYLVESLANGDPTS